MRDALCCVGGDVFQFTPLREGRRPCESKAPRMHNFNSRPSARGDNALGRNIRAAAISIHAPPRGATRSCWPCTASRRFQFTPLREGRHAQGGVSASADYFNSRPSARGDNNLGRVLQTERISIHAPPRGATDSGDRRRRCHAISIHAPPRGATHSARIAIYCRDIFQFTPLREGRRSSAKPFDKPKAFQFTPLREGRPFPCCDFSVKNSFQFTPLREGRRKNRKKTAFRPLFQFTPLREGRLPLPASLSAVCQYFNSRPSARGDLRTF